MIIDDVKLSETVINRLTSKYMKLYKYYSRICTINNYETETYITLMSINFVLCLHQVDVQIMNIQTLEYLLQFYEVI